MSTLLYIASILLILAWTIGLFVYSIGIIISVLIGLAVLSMLFGLFPARKKKDNAYRL